MEVNPMNSEEFEVNGRIFIRSTYLDISVLIDKETGYYYAQKICDDNDKRWADLERNNDYMLMKQAVSATSQISEVELEITFPGMPVGYRSKWVHKLLVNYIAQWANKEYAVKIAMLLNLIDERLKLENRTLQQEIASEKRLVEQLQTDNGNLNRQLNELTRQIQEVRNENAQTHQRLDQANEQLTTVHGQLDQANERLQTMSTVVSQVAEHLEESSKFVTENFNERNMTLGHVQEVIAIFSIKTFTDSQRLPDGFAVYDIFAGNPRFLRKTMLKRKYKPTEDELEHPVAVIDTSDAKDLLNYVRNNIDREFAAISPDSKLITNDIEATVKYITICKDKMVTLDRDAVSLHLSNLKNALRSALRDGLREVHERIDRIEANQNRIIDLLTRRRPNATKVLVNGRYRDLMFRNDGTVLYIPRANHREVELTEDDINRLRFKDNDGRNIELM